MSFVLSLLHQERDWTGYMFDVQSPENLQGLSCQNIIVGGLLPVAGVLTGTKVSPVGVRHQAEV